MLAGVPTGVFLNGHDLMIFRFLCSGLTFTTKRLLHGLHDLATRRLQRYTLFSGLDSSDTLNLKHYYRPGSFAMDSSHLISQHDSTPTFYEVSINDILSSADPQNFSTILDTATAI